MTRWFSMLICSLMLAASVICLQTVEVVDQQAEQLPASEVTPDNWPKTIEVDGVLYAVHQPLLDSWDGYHYAAHAVVSVLPAGAQDAIFGVINITANAITNRETQTVYLDNVTVTNTSFPSDSDNAGAYQQVFQKLVMDGPSSLPLARLESALIAKPDGMAQSPVAVVNTPPNVVFSPTPAVLVMIDGDPIWKALPGTSLSRLINTRALILQDSSGMIYLHLRDGFLSASSLTGPWTVATDVPSEAAAVAQNLAQAYVVDLMAGEPDEATNQAPSLQQGAPTVIVETSPTELIVTDGAPQWTSIPGTTLQYVENTTGDVFKNQNDQQLYLLVTGRWFSAPDFGGPWQYVGGRDLPADFANIPDDSPKENVKASIPGTSQAQDAVVANNIPQMADVDPAKTQFTPNINGDPQCMPIEGMPMSYVANSSAPIIRMNDGSCYAVQNGVWFSAPSLPGPWAVATAVPPIIYAIPPTSPLYYVTFVKIYNVTPQAVVEGYTPGYLGTVQTADGTVVYGTGYYYQPCVTDYVWYPTPVTYGYACNPCWTPWTGWFFGFGLGWQFGEHQHHCCDWGPAPYWGAMAGHHAGANHGTHVAAAWGPNRWAVTAGNVYRHQGILPAVPRPSAGFNAWTGNAWSSHVGHSYNSTTGQVSAGQHVQVQNVYTGNFAYAGHHGVTPSATGSANHGQPQGGTYFSTPNGKIYRNNGNSWEQSENGHWNKVQDPKVVRSLETQRWAQQAGDQRSAASTWGGRWNSNFHTTPASPSTGNNWHGGHFSGTHSNLGSFHGSKSNGNGNRNKDKDKDKGKGK